MSTSSFEGRPGEHLPRAPHLTGRTRTGPRAQTTARGYLIGGGVINLVLFVYGLLIDQTVAEYSALGEQYRAADHGGPARVTAAIIGAYNHQRARHTAAPPVQVTAA